MEQATIRNSRSLLCLPSRQCHIIAIRISKWHLHASPMAIRFLDWTNIDAQQVRLCTYATPMQTHCGVVLVSAMHPTMMNVNAAYRFGTQLHA
eukprot:256449-Amphidinium_carterae.2